MKKTKTVTTKKKVIPQSIKEVTKTYCDFCNTVVPDHGSYGWYPGCSLCNRDTCRKHNKPDPHEYGDYPDWYCYICYELKFDKYEDIYAEIEESYEEELNRLEGQIREESLARGQDVVS